MNLEDIAQAQEADQQSRDARTALLDDAFGLSNDNQKSKLHHNHPVNPFEVPVHPLPNSTVSVSPPGEVRPSKKY